MRKVKNTTEVLKRAKSLLQKVGWCKGQSVKRNRDNKPVAYCASGAINHAVGYSSNPHFYSEAIYRLNAIIGGGLVSGITLWNDDPKRKKKEVLAAFDKAIAEEEKKK
jgi:hypothetical protein